MVFEYKPRIYRGKIYETEADKPYLADIDTKQDHIFSISGAWVSNSKTISSYQLCDANGEALPEFENLQFSRTRNNIFLLEAVN